MKMILHTYRQAYGKMEIAVEMAKDIYAMVYASISLIIYLKIIKILFYKDY